MDDYQELEEQLKQTRERVDRLSISEKAKLRPVPPQPTFPWATIASAVGICAFVILIGLFARILANPSGEVASSGTTTPEIAINMETTVAANSTTMPEPLAISREEAITAAIAFAETQLRGGVTREQVVSAELLPPDPTQPTQWEIKLQGRWEINMPPTEPNTEPAVSPPAEVCTIHIDAEIGVAYSIECELAMITITPVEPLVSAGEITVLPHDRPVTEQFVQIGRVDMPSDASAEQQRVDLSFDYALTTAGTGLLVIHWGYYLDLETYNTGNIVAPITAGGGSATVTFSVDPRLINDDNRFVISGSQATPFSIQASLRTPNDTGASLIYFVPPDETKIEPALHPDSLREVGGHFLLAQDWATVEERLASGLFSGLIVHHAAVDLVDRETLEHYHDEENLLIAGLGVNVEWLINKLGAEFNEGYATPLFYNYSSQHKTANGGGYSRGGDSLIYSGGLAQFMTIVESWAAQSNIDPVTDTSSVVIGTLADFPPRDTPYFRQPDYNDKAGAYIVNIDHELRVFSPFVPYVDRLEDCRYAWNDAVERFTDPCSGDEWELDGTINLEHSAEMWSSGDLNQHPYTIENGRITVNFDEIIAGRVVNTKPTFGTSENPQTDVALIRRFLSNLQEKNRERNYRPDSWLHVKSEHFGEKSVIEHYWIQMNEEQEPELILWQSFSAGKLELEGIYHPDQPETAPANWLTQLPIDSILWKTDTLLNDDYVIYVAYTEQDENFDTNYVLTAFGGYQAVTYQINYQTGEMTEINIISDDRAGDSRIVYQTYGHETTLPPAVAHLLLTGSSEGSGWEATVDLYSGRPNPTWIIGVEDGIMLTDALEKTQRTGENSLFDHLGLGYRGVVVSGGGIEMRFLGGVVQIQEVGERTVYYDDADFALRDQVLATGEISAEIITAICSAEPSDRLCGD